MTLKELQKVVFDNKVARDFNITDVGKEIILLREELDELVAAYGQNDHEEMVDAVGDIAIYCIGLFQILGVDAETVLGSIALTNLTRTHRSRL